MRNKLLIIKILFIILSTIFFYRLVDLNLLSNPAAFNFKGLDSKINFAPNSTNHRVQVDYYSELTKGISEGKLSFSVLPEPGLLKMENPYGEQAATSGLILQDASLYKERYYIYYGIAPVIFLYLPIYKILNFIPTDALVITILSFFYIILITYLALWISKRNISISFIFYFSFLFNPIWLYGLNYVATAGVARVFCALCLIISYILTLRILSERNVKYELLIVFLLLGLAAITRPTYIPDCLFILLFLAFKKLRDNYKLFAIGTLIGATLFLLSIFYNYLRFDEFFENGQKYIVNGGDYINKGSIIQLPKFIFNLFYNFVYRFYEFFFSFPVLTPDGLTHLNMSTKSPLLAGAYSEGIVGYFVYNPALLISLILLIHITYKSWNFNNYKLLVLVSASLFFINFALISLLQLSTLHFVLEFIPRLMLFYFIMVYSINRSNNINKDVFNNKSLNALCFFLLIIPFQLALYWRTF
jgi:hypothetical protein